MVITTIFLIALGVFVIILVFKGVNIVPQAENWVVESFGKFSKTLKPGLNLINPIFARVAYKVDIREQFLELTGDTEQSIITSDNAVVTVNGIVFYKVMDPYKASYGIEDYKNAIRYLGITSLRSIMGRMTLDATFSSRELINAELLKILDEATDAWGTKITRVEIKDITPPKALLEAMSLQKSAEQQKRATILAAEASMESQAKVAEGEKRKMILEAEGRKESAEKDAEARERLMLAEAKSINMIVQALKDDKDSTVPYLLGLKYMEGLNNLGKSQNAKLVVFPSELLKTLEGIIKGIGKS